MRHVVTLLLVTNALTVSICSFTGVSLPLTEALAEDKKPPPRTSKCSYKYLDEGSQISGFCMAHLFTLYNEKGELIDGGHQKQSPAKPVSWSECRLEMTVRTHKSSGYKEYDIVIAGNDCDVVIDWDDTTRDYKVVRSAKPHKRFPTIYVEVP